MTNTLHIYTRVSTKVQSEDGTSLDTQKELGIKKASELGLEYKVWDEGGASSSYEDLLNRPVLTELLTNVEKGDIKHLFVYNNDRLSRNEITAQTIRIALQRHDVILYTKDGRFDFSNAGDKLFKTILEGIAQYDNALRAERSRMGKITRVRQNYWYGAPPPYGYEISKKRLVVNEEEGKSVKQIFEWVENGKSIKWIKTELDKNGVQPRRKHGSFSIGSIARLIKNTHYIGFYTWKDKKSGETITCECPPIIDEATWHTIQNIRKRNLQLVHQSNPTKNFYLLRDLLFCEHCGSKIAGRISTASRENLYYCPKKEKDWRNSAVADEMKWKHVRVGDYGCDMNRSLSIPLTDKFVCEKVLETISNSVLLKEKFKSEVLQPKFANDADNEQNIRDEKAKQKKLTNSIKELQSTIAEVETKQLLKGYDTEVYKRIIINLDNELQSLKNKLEKTRLNTMQLDRQNKWVDWVSKYHDRIAGFNEFSEKEKKEYLEGIIERINVRLEHETMEHVLTISFKLPLVDDGIKYLTSNKSDGYTLIAGKSEAEVHIPIVNRAGRKKNLMLHNKPTPQ